MNEEKKFKLKENDKQLQIFVMTVQGGQQYVSVPEDLKMYLAYDTEGAINLARADYPQGVPISINKRGSIPMEEIVKKLDINGPGELVMQVETPPKKEIVEKDFVYGLMMVVDKFVTDEEDKKTLTLVLNKVLKKYESA